MKFYIKEAREKAGFSQKDLARIIGVAPNTFHGYESGKHDPKSDVLIKIASACSVSVDFLLGNEQKNSPDPDKSESGSYVSIEESTRLLVALGLIDNGQQLTDDDVAFMGHVLGMLDTWFSSNRH